MSFNLEVVNTGVSANDGLGDPLRTAFSKSHNNDNTLSGNMLALSGSMIDMSGVISGDIDQALSTGAIHNTGQFLITGKIDPTGQSLLSTINSTGQSLSSAIDSTGQYITDNFVSGYVQNFVFDMPESGQSVVVSGLKQGPMNYDNSWYGNFNDIDSLYRGRYTLTLTERHLYYYATFSTPAREDWAASGAWYAQDNLEFIDGGNHTSDIYIFEFPVTNVGNHFEGGNHEYTIRLTGDVSDTTHRPRWVITRDSTHTYAPLTGHGEFSPNNNASSHNRRHEFIVNLVEY